MYKRILVPFDGSKESAQALPYARLVAKATGNVIQLFQAAPGLDILMRGWTAGDSVEMATATLSYEQWQDIQAEFKQTAQASLDSAAKELQGEGLRVQAIVGEGEPAEAIVAEAGKEPDTLIVMATHGRSGIARWNMGSVADKVVRTGNHPTLLVRSRKDAPAVTNLQGVVLPLDGSERSAGAIPHAIGMAKALGVGIHVLHIIQSPMYLQAPTYTQGDMFHEQLGVAEQRGQDYAMGITDRIRSEGIKDSSSSAISGDPASSILDAVGESGNRLVVMSTHGRSGLQRALLGSVTDKVVRNSHGPVLVVRPKA